MDNLTPHFSRSEFTCKDNCGFDAISPSLVESLETLRSKLNRPILILSGCRCEKHNTEVGGEKNSQHLLGHAADIRVPGLTAEEVCEAAMQLSSSHGEEEFYAIRGFGLDEERNFVHLDVRDTPARWRYQDGKVIPW